MEISQVAQSLLPGQQSLGHTSSSERSPPSRQKHSRGLHLSTRRGISMTSNAHHFSFQTYAFSKQDPHFEGQCFFVHHMSACQQSRMNNDPKRSRHSSEGSHTVDTAFPDKGTPNQETPPINRHGEPQVRVFRSTEYPVS